MNWQSIKQYWVIKLALDSFSAWMEDKALRLAAALAYYSIFSIAPMLVIAISLAGLVFGPEAVRGHLDDQLRTFVGREAAVAIQGLLKSASQPRDGWLGAITGFVILMVGASGVFGQLKDALNTIWEVKPKTGGGVKQFLTERLLSFGMVLVIGFLLLVSLLLTTAIAALSQWLGAVLGVPGALWALVAFGLSVGMVTALFAVIFKVLPDARVQWKNVWVGALVTALLFEVGKFGLSFYLGRESTTSAYGAAGSVVVLLLWVYYASCILLLGAEFTQVYSRATGHVIEPSTHAVAVTAKARVQEGLESEGKPSRQISAPSPPRFVPVPQRPVPFGPTSPIVDMLVTTAAAVAAGLLIKMVERKANDKTAKLRERVRRVRRRVLG